MRVGHFVYLQKLMSAALAGLVSCVAAATVGGGPAFRHIGVHEGLPDHHVEAMVQDSSGFVWIATRNGLVRHEGHRIRPVPIELVGAGDFSDANILTLSASQTGSVWASIAGHGVVEMGPDLSVRRHLRPLAEQGRLLDSNVWSITEDCDGHIWIAFVEGGLARYQPDRDELQLLPQSARFGLAEVGFQMHLEVDKDCRLWLVQSQQLSFKAPGSELAFQIVASRRDDAPLMTSFRSFSDGDMYLLQGQQLKSVRHDGERWKIQTALESEGVIVDVEDDQDGWLSLATFSGMVRWHPETGERQTIRAQRGINNGLPTNQLLHMMRDQDGGLWTSVARSGIVYLPPDAWAFQRFQQNVDDEQGLPMRSVYAVLAAREPNTLWIAGRTEGLHRLDLATGFTQPASEHFNISGLDDLQRINRLIRMKEELVIAWTSQVDALNLETLEIGRLFESQQLVNGTVRVVSSNQIDELWLGTFEKGLYRYRNDQALLEHFPPDERGLAIPAESGITAIAQDQSGAWWMAAGSRLFLYNDDKDSFSVELELLRGSIRALYFNARELVLATDQNIQIWRQTGSTLESVASQSFRDLVPGGRPFAIVEDTQGENWLFLTSGLLHFDLEQATLDFIGPDRGLAIGELLEYAFALLPNGTMAIGGSQGLALFDPSRVGDVQTLADVKIVRVSSAGDDLGLAQHLELEHQRRDIEIEFSSPTFVNPARLRYRVRLLGEHEDWRVVEGQNLLQYFDLSPGSYRFEVQVGHRGGRWERASDSVSIRIAYPPWLQPLALLVYALITLGVLIWTYRFRTRMQKRKQRFLQARQDRVVAERANAAKSDFLATMSHEMRTPLHGVLGMLELIQGQNREPKVAELLDTAQTTGRQLTRIVDDVLDLSRIEAEQLVLTVKPFELVAALEHVVELFAPLAASARLDLRLRVSSTLPSVAIGDRDRLAQVIGNLLSNAIKFTPAGGIEVEVRDDQAGTLLIRVTDSGPGISEAQRGKLFERFHQLGHANGSTQRGSGLGLAITRQLIQAMGGRICLVSRRSSGACFEIQLPDYLVDDSSIASSRLLRELKIDSDISPSDRRSVHRLARRWGFSHRRSILSRREQESEPVVMLIDPRVRMPVERLDAYSSFFYLDPPFVAIPGLWIDDPRFISLGWPLTERRLIRGLFQWAMRERG